MIKLLQINLKLLNTDLISLHDSSSHDLMEKKKKSELVLVRQ